MNLKLYAVITCFTWEDGLLDILCSSVSITNLMCEECKSLDYRPYHWLLCPDSYVCLYFGLHEGIILKLSLSCTLEIANCEIKPKIIQHGVGLSLFLYCSLKFLHLLKVVKWFLNARYLEGCWKGYPPYFMNNVKFLSEWIFVIISFYLLFLSKLGITIFIPTQSFYF